MQDNANPFCPQACLLPLRTKKNKTHVWVLPDDVGQDPQLDQTAHHSHPPVPHQHLARGLILKEEVGESVGDLALHLLSWADPQTGGPPSSPRSHTNTGAPPLRLVTSGSLLTGGKGPLTPLRSSV